MTRRMLQIAKLHCAALLLAALALVGFAHKTAPLVITPDIQAYLDMGGQWIDICGDIENSGHSASPTCDACRFTAFCPPDRGASTFAAVAPDAIYMRLRDPNLPVSQARANPFSARDPPVLL